MVAYLTQDAGTILHKRMADVVARRLFQRGVLDPHHDKVAFASGLAWVSFTRICGPPNFHVDTMMEHLLDTRDRWTDSVKALSRLAFDGHLS